MAKNEYFHSWALRIEKLLRFSIYDRILVLSAV